MGIRSSKLQKIRLKRGCWTGGCWKLDRWSHGHLYTYVLQTVVTERSQMALATFSHSLPGAEPRCRLSSPSTTLGVARSRDVGHRAPRLRSGRCGAEMTDTIYRLRGSRRNSISRSVQASRSRGAVERMTMNHCFSGTITKFARNPP